MTKSNICIYTKQPHDNSIIKSGDHIMLSAIGGIKKLPNSYVSHIANNHLSKLEKHLTRDSILSLVRQFEGPGKRGSLNPKKASKSKIQVMISKISDEPSTKKYTLGYLELGKPYSINQFIFDLNGTKIGDISVSLNLIHIKNESEYPKYLNDLFNKARIIEDYILIIQNELPENIALFGEFEKNWYLALNNKSLEPLALRFIDHIKKSESQTINTSKKMNNQVSIKQNINFDLNITFRAIAKMAFNLLAYEKGQDYILNERFDPIRNWIFYGDGDNHFVQIMENDYIMQKRFGSLFPESAHYILINQTGLELIAMISFYGETFSFFVKLTDIKPEEKFFLNPIGLICDWRNRKEYTLLEFAVKITELNVE